MSLKDLISSPLEAGTSILDAHHLPLQLTPALEYTSSRLARKSIHVTLVVVRRDYQLPTIVPPKGSPGLPMPTTPTTPSRFSFSSKPVSTLKQMVRSASYHGPSRRKAPVEASGPRLRGPLTPSTPSSPPPMTPCTASSSTTDTMGSIMAPSSLGMRLIHANDLPAKAERFLRATLHKAEMRFQVGAEWLSPAVGPAACGLTNQLIHASILQNEVLFSSEGLTLLSLDHLYSLKSALSSYSKTRSHLRLEDAVDELRRTILANNGAKVLKADILRSYDWLRVSKSALNDLDRMYRRAYGGPEQVGAISGMAKFIEPVIRTASDYKDDIGEVEDGSMGTAWMPLQHSPTPKAQPVLKLRTNFDTKPRTNDDEERTARPTDGHVPFTLQSWNNSSIDKILSADLWSAAESSPKQGPTTPKGYDDISPTTRGEWGFLMVDNTLQAGRTVAVETW